jgi:hypothetical protein
MSGLDETKSDLVVLERITSHQGLMKVNRLLMSLVFFLMAVIVIAGVFYLPKNEFTQFKKTEATISEINPVLSVEVNTLKSQFVGLVSGSIESKLRSLEESIRSGSVTSSLGTVEDLKNDVKILQTYSEPIKKEKSVVPDQQIIQEMSHLKHLVYLTMASCGLMLAVIGGIWYKIRYRLAHKESIIRYLDK